MKPQVKWWVASATLAGLMFLTTRALAVEAIRYAPSARYPWGPRSDGQPRPRPAGLPENTRRASVEGVALPYVERFAQACIRRWNAKGIALPAVPFVQTLLTLAQNESRGTFGLPGLPFNLRPRRAGESAEGGEADGSADGLPSVGEGSDGSGDSDRPISTAWGVFQWRQDDWNGISTPTYFKPLTGHAPSLHPWTATPHDEIYYPIERYGQIYKLVLSEGGTPLEAAYTILLYHQSPTAYDKMRTLAKRTGYADAVRAWAQGASEKQVGYHNKSNQLLQKAFPLLPSYAPYYAPLPK
jgi:hypothetical protein